MKHKKHTEHHLPTVAPRCGVIARYAKYLPLPPEATIYSLGEGSTPLIRLDRLSAKIGGGITLYAKFDGMNPTGSFKDRGMTVAITEAVASGKKAVICASTGNTSASAAAYAARAGIKAFVLIPEGKIARGKLAQAVMHGATILQISGNFDEGMRLVKTLGETAPVCVVNSINPYRIQGQKTAAFEICEALGQAPDYHYLPVGNAGNITAHWIGYSEYYPPNQEKITASCGFCDGHCRYARHQCAAGGRPIMVGCQADGAAPFIKGAFVDAPETVATAIRIGHPQSWQAAHEVRRESSGWFLSCTDAEILSTQRQLAESEGVFCEPASAISIAGVMRDVTRGKIISGSTVVCTLTGHGLKDHEVAFNDRSAIVTVSPDLEKIRQLVMDAG